MKKLLILLAVVIGFGHCPSAQPHYAEVLKIVEARNPMLRAARHHAEAQQVQAHVGALIPDPSISASYFWADPASIGPRWDLAVSQSFELPSVLVRRARLRDLESKAAEIGYGTLRNATLLEAQLACAEMVYCNALTRVYDRICRSAIQLAALYRDRYAAGDCSLIEYNRAQMNLADVQDKAATINLRRDHAVHDLRTLLDTNIYEFYQVEFEPVAVESSFEEWYDTLEMKNPALQQLHNQYEKSKQQASLSRWQWLPTMEVGYASENHADNAFRGVKVGFTIPLMSSQRAARAAAMEQRAAEEELVARRIELFNVLRCMFHRHEALIRNWGNLKSALEQCSSVDLLDKALQQGEISLEQYLQQVDYYYEMEVRMYDVAYELEQLHLQLYSITL